MKPIVGKTHLAQTTGITSTGQSKAPATKKVVAPATEQPKVTGPKTTSEGGLHTTTKPDGSVAKKTDSGLQSVSNTEGTTITLPGDQGKFKIDAEGQVQVEGGGAKNAAMRPDDNGAQLLNFSDKKGHDVWVDPQSLTYSVVKTSSLNENNITAQVFLPDGNQQVVVQGTHRGPEGDKNYANRATFDSAGKLVSNEGFENLKTKGGKVEFDLGGSKTTRELPRALPGQAEPAPETKTKTETSAPSNAPTSLIAEQQPLLLPAPEPVLLLEGPKSTDNKPADTGKVDKAPEAPVQDPAKAAADAAKLDRKNRLDALRQTGPDFFVPDKNPDAAFLKSQSGVIKRMDDDSVAFSLPTGDKFRTDGEVVAVLGDNPRAKNARIVTEDDGRVLLAYKDKNRNSYQLDVNTGDLEVSNADGSMRQKLMADGTEKITATSVHTTEAGSVRTSNHSATFAPDGTLVEKSGFDNLQTGKKHLEYTLPNGNNTVRNLLMETKGQAEPPKAKDGWGDTQGAVDSLLGNEPVKAAAGAGVAAGAAATAGADGPAKMNHNPFDGPQDPPTTVSGVTRRTLPDGSVETKLPTGITFRDGENPQAFDVDGKPLRLQKTEVPSEGGYMLTTKGKDGVAYTIAPEHLDYIAEGKEGKVHQVVRADGGMLTSITDGPRQHVHEFKADTYQHQHSPGVMASPDFPGHIQVADHPQNRTYELPVSFPPPPGSQQPQPFAQGGPGMQQGGVQPSLWSKVKGWFTGETPQAQPRPGAHPNHHQMPPCSGMPCSHHQYDPIADQMKSMNRMNNAMMALNVVGLGATMLSTLAMPGMFFPYGGGYGMGYW